MRKLIVGAVLVAAPFVCGGVAHADVDDDGVGQSICTAWQLGESPSQIAEQLHQGQPRINQWQAAHDVWDRLQEGC